MIWKRGLRFWNRTDKRERSVNDDDCFSDCFPERAARYCTEMPGEAVKRMIIILRYGV